MTTAQATPVIAQYLTIKEKHQDCLVFFQMGDFYELFFDDAQIAATELDIVLTYRGKYQDQDIPMCGVPVHNYASYSEKLVQRGYKIAVCAQVETPQEAKKRGYKAIVNRQIVRIVTAGTLTEDHLLDARQDNFLCIIFSDEHFFCAFFYDISTGKLHYFNERLDSLKNLVAHKKPSEIIFSQPEIETLLQDVNIPKTQQPLTHDQLLPVFDAYAHTMSALETQALTILSHYLKRTQCAETILIQSPEPKTYSDFLQIDDAGQVNLEIFKTISGQKKPTLLSTLDQCKTAAGARMLAEYLNFPITNKETLNQRYDAISFFMNYPKLAEGLQIILKKTADLNRILGRLKTGRCTPADLGQIRNTLHIIYSEFPSLKFDHYSDTMPTQIMDAYNGLCTPISCYNILQSALKETLPVTLKMGDFIAEGYDGLLDQYKSLKENARHYILELEQKYKDITQINALKIKHNNVIGYHIDVSSNHSEKMLNASFADVTFIHKQTLANHVRFTTQELIGLEKKISEASLSYDQREKELFSQICTEIDAEIQELLIFSNAIAHFDLYASHALFALGNHYCRPELVDQKVLNITAGRHSVIEALLKKQSKSFIPNNASFKYDQKQTEIWLVTGPNMGGKSTYLRQTVLMIIMAQAGLFVPADAYKAGIFDKIFSRVGASDNLAEGKSTFMSEMSETANILKNATAKSFVILDELGRGTSTYDGLALAYATLKYLSETIGAMGLFATHYHKLTEMISHHKRIGNLQTSVKHHKDDIIFLHKVSAGAAKKSYGIHVATLAGMPVGVLHDAHIFLKSIEKQKNTKILTAETTPLFQEIPDQEPIIIEPEIKPNPIIEEIKTIDLNSLTPMDALGLINQWQKTMH